MLESIQINHFTIIDTLRLDFNQGMTVLTGETGAGKSILLNAIKLISGGRADIEYIKSGEDKAEISVCFDISQQPQISNWLKKQTLDSDNECIIRRVLYSNSRSKAFINGFSAPLSQLRELTQMLVDLHGQHEHQSLQKTQVQQQLLDSYLDNATLLTEVQRKYDDWHSLQIHYRNLKQGSKTREQRIDLLQLYCQELNEINLKKNEIDQLQADCRRLSCTDELLDAIREILVILHENDENTIQSLLSHCQQTLTDQLKDHPKLYNCHELISSALIQIEEANRELRHYHDSINLDKEQLDYLNQQIANIQTLARKHHINSTDLPEYKIQLDRELKTLQTSNHDLSTLEQSMQIAKNAFLENAKILSTQRQKTAKFLSRQITEIMQQLGMQGGRFLIQVQPTDTESNFRHNGIDQINYLVSTNPGQPFKPLNKVASGGELSRISLAIQVILSKASLIPTLIFDEADAGIGGGVAEIVGQKLRELSKNRQVFCITHLPQVAAQAQHHYRVAKNKADNNTTTQVVMLNEQARLEEIARMLGGITITEQTRAHASEMITTKN